jgi:hypothetical protein
MYSSAATKTANLSAACKFGATGISTDFLMLPATVLSDKLIRCETPTARSFASGEVSSVSIWLTFNGVDFHAKADGNPLLFDYFVTPEFVLPDPKNGDDGGVEPMVPVSGMFTGGTVVKFRWPVFPTKIGTLWKTDKEAYAGAACKFGNCTSVVDRGTCTTDTGPSCCKNETDQWWHSSDDSCCKIRGTLVEDDYGYAVQCVTPQMPRGTVSPFAPVMLKCNTSSVPSIAASASKA